MLCRLRGPYRAAGKPLAVHCVAVWIRFEEQEFESGEDTALGTANNRLACELHRIRQKTGRSATAIGRREPQGPIHMTECSTGCGVDMFHLDPIRAPSYS